MWELEFEWVATSASVGGDEGTQENPRLFFQVLKFIYRIVFIDVY